MGKYIGYTRFCRFLKEKGLYRCFLNEFIRPFQTNMRANWLIVGNSVFKPIVNRNSMEEFCDKLIDKKLIINYAFSWRDTQEGHEFWDNLAREWQDVCPMWEDYFNIK